MLNPEINSTINHSGLGVQNIAQGEEEIVIAKQAAAHDLEVTELFLEERRNGHARHLYRAACDLDQLGRCRDALPLYEESLDICREISNRAGAGAALKRIGRICHACCDYGKALACLEESLTICRECADRAGQG
ncbi:MAG: tetratricopeptide repeat protein, partial [Candidatus Electrothrix sp. ATG2]|nr:tetratricopeptide repeat protein [Candidatus Electrothrix sp. ATG2]